MLINFSSVSSSKLCGKQSAYSQCKIGESINDGKLYKIETGVNGEEGGVSKNDGNGEGLRTRYGDVRIFLGMGTSIGAKSRLLEKLKTFLFICKFESDDDVGYFLGKSTISDSLAVVRQLKELEMLLTRRGEKLNMSSAGGTRKLLELGFGDDKLGKSL